MKEINYIKRSQYINSVRPFMNKSLIKVFTGQRRVGKSYLLFQLMQEIRIEDKNANIIYINCEDFDFDFIKSAKELHDYVISKRKPGIKSYIFIDEVQEIEEFERTIRSLALDENNDIYITGSNANLLSGELATFLSGRYIEFKVQGLSYLEFIEFHGLENNFESYQLYAKYGGLPYLIHLKLTDDVVGEYLKSIYSTIIFRDVVSRNNLRDTDFLEKLTRYLADNVGSLFSAQSISNYLKSQKSTVSVKQVQNYVAHLANAFLIYRTERYDIVGKRIFDFGEKFYFEDLGIRNIITGYKIEDRARILENIVYNHLIFRGYDVKTGSVNSKEIDFVCKRNNELLYVQVAVELTLPETIEREFGNLLRINDNYPKIVVTEDNFQGNTHQGIQQVYILDFLTKY
ncbi:MAG: ATP-binding protein [Bacteroidia bacterium]|nr:ATP-binding protein [Bacteroidia bacterium]